MSALAAPHAKTSSRGTKPHRMVRWWIACGAVIAFVLVTVLGTKVVPDGAQTNEQQAAVFNKEEFGAQEFPKVQAAIEERAIPAPELSRAIIEDPEAAADEYGQEAAGSFVYATTFTGTVGEGSAGIYEVTIPGMPDGVTVRIQTGPAINGTELRDATGEYGFSEFTNQIDYQDAGAALNDEMKKEVLASVDTTNLSGKTITVTGVFTAINPEGWLITPSKMEVQ